MLRVEIYSIDSAHNLAIVRKVQEEFHEFPPLEVKGNSILAYMA